MINHNFEKLEIPLVAKLFTIYEMTHRLIFSLPKFERYTLGEKIEQTVLRALELVVIVNSVNKFEKEKILAEVNAKIELLKLLYRLALNCNLIETRKYLSMEQELQEAGKQAQGWLKFTRNNK
jgi:hypothetical protein